MDLVSDVLWDYTIHASYELADDVLMLLTLKLILTSAQHSALAENPAEPAADRFSTTGRQAAG